MEINIKEDTIMTLDNLIELGLISDPGTSMTENLLIMTAKLAQKYVDKKMYMKFVPNLETNSIICYVRDVEKYRYNSVDGVTMPKPLKTNTKQYKYFEKYIKDVTSIVVATSVWEDVDTEKYVHLYVKLASVMEPLYSVVPVYVKNDRYYFKFIDADNRDMLANIRYYSWDIVNPFEITVESESSVLEQYPQAVWWCVGCVAQVASEVFKGKDHKKKVLGVSAREHCI